MTSPLRPDVTVDGAVAYIHVHCTFNCCHRTHLLRLEKLDVVADSVALCEWAFKPYSNACKEQPRQKQSKFPTISLIFEFNRNETNLLSPSVKALEPLLSHFASGGTFYTANVIPNKRQYLKGFPYISVCSIGYVMQNREQY